jgi:hypothetical protein
MQTLRGCDKLGVLTGVNITYENNELVYFFIIIIVNSTGLNMFELNKINFLFILRKI